MSVAFDVFDDAVNLMSDFTSFQYCLLFFDLEVAFLLLWAAVGLDQISWVLGAMLFFLLLLVVGFVYEWRSKALEWE